MFEITLFPPANLQQCSAKAVFFTEIFTLSEKLHSKVYFLLFFLDTSKYK